MEANGHLYVLVTLHPGTHCIGGGVDPTDGLVAVELNPESLVVKPIA
jgi:hypothetical protein